MEPPTNGPFQFTVIHKTSEMTIQCKAESVAEIVEKVKEIVDVGPLPFRLEIQQGEVNLSKTELNLFLTKCTDGQHHPHRSKAT